MQVAAGPPDQVKMSTTKLERKNQRVPHACAVAKAFRTNKFQCAGHALPHRDEIREEDRRFVTRREIFLKVCPAPCWIGSGCNTSWLRSSAPNMSAAALG